MRRGIIICLAALVALSCEGEYFRSGLEPAGRRQLNDDCTKRYPPTASTDSSSVQKPPEDVKQPHLYVAGVRYPEGYDWRRDEEYGTVDCTLFLLRDGEPVLELPVLRDSLVFSDSDAHRIVGGHLYTDGSDAFRSVLKRDGRLVYRVEGREMISSLLERDDGSLWTLCPLRSGKGFTLRRNGEPRLVSGGQVLSALHEDGGRLCFSYEEDGVYKIYVEREQEEFHIPFSSYDYALVSELRMAGGSPVGVVRGNYGLALVQGETLFPILPQYSSTNKFRELNCEGDGSFLVSCEQPLSDSTAIVRVFEGSQMKEVCYKTRHFATRWDGKNLAVVVQNGKGVWSVVMGSDWKELPGRPVSAAAVCLHEGRLTVSLDVDGSPALWTDGETQLFSLNGIIDAVAINYE